MELPTTTVLIFDRDEDLLVLASFVQATDWIEAIDVDEGEYPAVYSPDGGVLALSAPEGPEGSVVLTETGRVDLDDLERRVARYWRRHRAGEPPRDPLRTAQFLLERDDKPRRGWLSQIAGLLRRGTAAVEPTAVRCQAIPPASTAEAEASTGTTSTSTPTTARSLAPKARSAREDTAPTRPPGPCV
jgi:hypothetical protein